MIISVKNGLKLIQQWELSQPLQILQPISITRIDSGDFDFDGFSTYYIIEVKEGETLIDNEEIINGLYGFQTPIVFTLSARRLSKGQQFQQLNKMQLEVIRIMANTDRTI